MSSAGLQSTQATAHLLDGVPLDEQLWLRFVLQERETGRGHINRSGSWQLHHGDQAAPSDLPLNTWPHNVGWRRTRREACRIAHDSCRVLVCFRPAHEEVSDVIDFRDGTLTPDGIPTSAYAETAADE